MPSKYPIVFPALLSALLALPLITGCEVDVEEEGKMPSVDVDADPGRMPEYEVEKTQEGRLPSVDMDAEPGRMPEVDVRGPDVDVGTQPLTIPVPDVDVELPQEEEDATTTDRPDTN
jgi:hypothetical protein